MADELFTTLTRFHREVIAPEFERINARLDTHDARFDEMMNHFDAIYHRFDRLEVIFGVR